MSESVKNFAEWLGILGVPSIFGLCVFCLKLCIKSFKQIKILMEAQQKQMARDLTVDYKEYIKQGWIDTEDLDLWEQNYQKYHALGANGVMDNKRAKLFQLPNIPPTNN